MNTKLLRSCAALWLFGLFGMVVARAILALEVQSLPFRAAGGLWILGGLGYTGLSLLALATRSVVTERGAPEEADLSVFLRKQ